MTTNNDSAKKRKIILINKSFQGRFVASILSTIILFGVCSAGILYWLIGGDLEVQSQAAHINITNTWQRLGLSLLIGNIVAAVIAGLMAIIVVLYISHKIAGPLYRFETLCKQVSEGNFNTVTHLRSNDQLQELAQSFSVMVDKLRSREESKNQLISELNEQLNHLKKTSDLTLEQNKIVQSITSILKKFKEL